MKNLYKRTDIFSCIHEAHRGYKKSISVYHILKEKECYPDGCFYFRWHCKQLSKSSKCRRGFSHIGHKCFSCKDFYEDKVHNHPELQISETAYRDFLRELDWFEDWLAEFRHKDIEFAGTVDGVKPHFTKKVYPKASHLSFRGYILIFRDIFLDRTRFEDFVYLRLSGQYFNKLRPGKGTTMEGRARLHTDRGRLILSRPRGIEITRQGEPALWNDQELLFARESATEFTHQPEHCVQCPFGALADVEYLRDHHSFSRRQLLCLKGMKDYRDCYISAEYCGLDRESRTGNGNSCDSAASGYIP